MGLISSKPKRLFSDGLVKESKYMGPYLVPDVDTVVSPARKALSALMPMTNGSMPNDGGGLLLEQYEYAELLKECPEASRFIRRFLGSNDSIKGEMRYCLWIDDSQLSEACQIAGVRNRIELVRKHRQESDRPETQALA